MRRTLLTILMEWCGWILWGQGRGDWYAVDGYDLFSDCRKAEVKAFIGEETRHPDPKDRQIIACFPSDFDPRSTAKKGD